MILSSKLPNAKRFKRWVTSEVLPAIRKHGAYFTDKKIEEVLLNPDTIIKLATELKTERERRLIAEQKVNEYEPKASYYDSILVNPSLVTITQIAKDYGMSGRAMNTKLHELNIKLDADTRTEFQRQAEFLMANDAAPPWTGGHSRPCRKS